MIRQALVYFWSQDSAITALVGTRIYADFAAQEGAFPHITMTRTTTPRWNSLNQGPSGIAVPLIQVTCWALTRTQAVTLAKLLRNSQGGVSNGPKLNGFAGQMPYGGGNFFAVQSIRVSDERDDLDQPEHGDEGVVKYTTLDLSICYAEP